MRPFPIQEKIIDLPWISPNESYDRSGMGIETQSILLGIGSGRGFLGF